MAEEFCGGPNWWGSTTTTRNRFEGGSGGGNGGGSSTTSTTTTLANRGSGPPYVWVNDESTTVDNKMDASSIELVGLGLSSHAMEEWNQQQSAITRNTEKAENNFRSMLEEGMNLNTNFQQDTNGVIFGNNNTSTNTSQLQQWRSAKLFPSNEDSNLEFKQINRGFSLDNQLQFSPSGSSIESTVTCQGLVVEPSNFQLDSSSILQGLMGSEQQNQHLQSNQQLNSNKYQQNYFGMGVTNDHQHGQQQLELSTSWAKVPQFLRINSLKQQQQQQQQQQLHFINNTPYWSASSPLNNTGPNFSSLLSASQSSNMPTFEKKPKTTIEVRETNSMIKKNSNTENNSKRTRNDSASSTLPPFKVRKEKMGDRITALQQLVSPFGKTDTASVLSEAIEYIKFLHEQVSDLSNPYLKSGGTYQEHQQSNEKAKVDPDSPKQDLRSLGLCLVPISSTFPVTHETMVDFWTPTFGGTFR